MTNKNNAKLTMKKNNTKRTTNKNIKKRNNTEKTTARTTTIQNRGAKKSTKRISTGNSGNTQGIPMKNEIQLIASFGIMLILMLSNFGCCGTVGVWLSSFFFGIFGCVQYVMPIAFFLMITVLLANDYSLLAMKKCGAGFVALTMISSFAQLVYQKNVEEFYDLFVIAASDHRAGGVLGGGIGLVLKNWFGMPGAIVIISCILLLSLVLLTQRSFVGFFRQSVSGIQKTIKESRQKYEKVKTEKASHADKLREKQCEEKIKEMEEEKENFFQKKKIVPERKTEKKEQRQPDIRIHIPVFTPSDEVKKKDSMKELRPEIYPFTAEDGKPKEFKGSLDFASLEESIFAEEENVQTMEMPETSLPETMALSSEKERSKTTEQRTGWITDQEEEEAVQLWEDEREESKDSKSEEEMAEKEVLERKDTDKMPFRVEEKEKPQENVIEVIPEEPVIEVLEEPKQEKSRQEQLLGKEVTKKEEKKDTGVPAKAEMIKTEKAGTKEYIFPPLNLLVTEKQTLSPDYDQVLKETAMKLQSTLESFGVNVTITDISCGPTVTRYEMFPEQGTKVSKILSLTDDIKLNLAASDIRIEAPIPGKAAIGIEVPNKHNMTVHFRELIDNRVFRNFKSKLAFAVGKDIGGKIVVTDLDKMPHLLIAGATGSGKSVCINTLIMSILYKAKPSEVKLIMIDPKMVELSTYNGIPHLLIPVVTDPKKASGALNWAVAEMTDRYKKLKECGVRNIEGYNKKVDELIASGEVNEEKMSRMPQIVIIIDELADLMMVSPGEVEDAIVRLSQLARAAGIHLVIATQRPSVNVITGLIKANVPSRIAFSVSSGVDSRTIIDMNGAEKLLGKGDMLFYPSGYQKPIRVQGAFISDTEVNKVVEFLKENEDVAVYDTAVSEKIESKIKKGSLSREKDEYFEAAARFIMEKDKATIGMLQRMFKIGFNRAARIIDQLADAGIVGPEEGTKPRKILMTPEQLDEYFEENL